MTTEPIETRLQNTATRCVKSYTAWQAKKTNIEAREALMEAVHELRKAAARIEVEVAVSERDENAVRPLPAPPHRATSRRRSTGEDEAASE